MVLVWRTKLSYYRKSWGCESEAEEGKVLGRQVGDSKCLGDPKGGCENPSDGKKPDVLKCGDSFMHLNCHLCV